MALSKIRNDSLEDNAVHGRRNIFINGAMQVAQRGTSVTGLSSGSSYHTSDRWNTQFGSAGTFTQSQSTTAPDGFTTSLKLDCTTADSSPDYLLIVQRIEGQNLQHLQKGTSGAKKLTLSFYVRSSKTGTYQVNLTDIDNTRNIGATYTISTADTWEYKTITFAGDTTGTLGNDNGNSLQVEWWLAAGSTYNSGSVPTSWEAQSSGDRAAGLTVNIGASTSDDFYLTGCQLEVGEKATPFEHRSYGDELQRCQRYYEMTGAGAPAKANSSTEYWVGLKFQVAKRANPTASMVDPNTAIRIFEFGVGDRDSDSTPSISSAYYNLHGANVRVGTFSGISAGGTAITGGTTGDSSANQFAFDAEL